MKVLLLVSAVRQTVEGSSMGVLFRFHVLHDTKSSQTKNPSTPVATFRKRCQAHKKKFELHLLFSTVKLGLLASF